MKEFANISMKAVADLIALKTVHGRAAVSASSVFSGTHFLQMPIRMYLLLHFYADSNTGIVAYPGEEVLSAKLSCSRKTVSRSLERLASAGLLSVSFDREHDTASVQILNIRDMYLRRGEGGRGFFTCSSALLEKLLSIKGINPLRLTLRALLQTLSNELGGSAKRAEASLSFRELRLGLPSYLKPCVIRSSISEGTVFSELFERITPDRAHSVSVSLKKDFNGKLVKNRLRSAARNRINLELTNLNRIIGEINESIRAEGLVPIRSVHEMLTSGIDLTDLELTSRTKPIPALFFDNALKESAVTIAQDYGIDTIIKAIRIYYSNYLLPGLPIINQHRSSGGLLRRIVEELFRFEPDRLAAT